MTQHWRKHDDPSGIRWLLLDKADSRTNALSQQVLEELSELLDEMVAEPPTGLIIKSGKDSGFVAGADISEFGRIASIEQAEKQVIQAQAMLARLESLRCPTVAAINGFALGGGLELALACDYRVAVDDYDRCMGLPEVQLGIHPGFGGTVRSIRLLGVPVAMDLMLTGRLLSPVEALAAGLIDRTAAVDELDEVARMLVAQRPPKRRAPFYLAALNLKPVRHWLAGRMRARLARKAPRDHYPAPYALVDLWVRYGARGAAAYRAEARSIAQLLFTETSRNLVRVFFLRERLRGLAPKSAAVARVHVVGAGVMGGDIASWCALQGLTVSLQDRAMKFVEPALERARVLFQRRLKAPGAAQAARQRLSVDLEGQEVAAADVIIEAIVERLDAKQELFRELESGAGPTALLATNTSSIRLEEISRDLSRPERFVGLHFFNPVARLPLVEVIRGESTDEASLSRAMSFVTQIGKLPLPCRSAPGFVVNRILAPYMLEALLAHEDGHALETIDKAAENFGMPTGPVELADRVGLDIAASVVGILGETLGTVVPALLQAKVDAGELGAKTGGGFYRFENGRPRKSSDYARPDEELQDRLILAMVNEAMACFEDGVVEELDLLDAGVIFGAGFPPFTGGAIHYARHRGIEAVVQRLESLAAAYGPRFAPRPGWQKLISEAQSR